MTTTLKLFCDGGSRSNPGDAGIGVVAISCNGLKQACILEQSIYLKNRSNNFAEYMAVITALDFALAEEQSDYDAYILHSDSMLIIKQLIGDWKVKHPDLRRLYSQAFAKIGDLINREKIVECLWIPREANKHADSLANLAMDRKMEPAARQVRLQAETALWRWEAAIFRHDQALVSPQSTKEDLVTTWREVVDAWKDVDRNVVPKVGSPRG